MATAMIYDTLKLAEQLEREAGFDAARARAMARILAENAGGNLATREDLHGLDERVGRLDERIGRLDEKVGALRGDIRVLYWMTGTTLAGVATLLGGAITVALHFMHLE